MLEQMPSDGLTIQLTVQHDNIVGRSRINLLPFPLPVSRCTIEPSTDGYACETWFMVSCTPANSGSFHYTLHQGDLLVGVWPAVPFRTWLLDSGQYSARIRIGVIADTNTETTVESTIAVQPCRTIPSTLAEIRAFIETAATLARSGDIGSALILIHTAMPAIGRTNLTDQHQLVQLALQIVSAMAVPGPVQHVDMVVNAVDALGRSTTIDHRLALRASHIVRSIGMVLQHMQSESSEADRFVQEAELWSRIEQLLTTIERLIVPTDMVARVRIDEQVPLPIEYPYIEQYPDYVDLDDGILSTLANRLRSVQNIEATIAALAALIDRQLLPAEPDVRLTLTNLSLVSVARESGTPTTIDAYANLSVSIAPTAHRHILTVCAFRSNPMWWYPEAFAVNSDVVYMHHNEQRMTHSALQATTGSVTTIHIIFGMHMPSASSDGTDVSVAHSDNDMPVFALTVPANGVLYVAFRLPGEAASLRVYFQADTRPTHYAFVRGHQTIRADQLMTNWANVEGRQRVLYMAIMAGTPVASGAELMDFQFRTKIGTCRRWSRSVWLSAGRCRVGVQTNRTHLHCVCDFGAESLGHVFAAQLYVAPNQLRLPRDLQLALEDNWLVIGLVLLLLLVYGWWVRIFLCDSISKLNRVDDQRSAVGLACGSSQRAG